MRRANDEVQRKSSFDRQADFERLVELVAAGHDDEQIDVAVLVRPAVGVRAEEDDLLRLEFLGHLARKASDGRLRHVRAAIPTRRQGLRFRMRLRIGTGLGAHHSNSITKPRAVQPAPLRDAAAPAGFATELPRTTAAAWILGPSRQTGCRYQTAP